MDVTTHRERRTALDERLDAARASGGFDSDRAWSLAAGLSAGYLKTQRHRASVDANHRMPEDGATELARVANVSVTWLRTGRGEMSGSDPLPARTVPTSPGGSLARLALVEALRRDPSKYTGEDFLAAMDAVREGEAMLPRDEEARIVTMGRLLRATARLRAEGQPVTLTTLAWTLAAGEVDEKLNEEARASLAALGAEPPGEPVRTPARGVQAVPVAPKPLKS